MTLTTLGSSKAYFSVSRRIKNTLLKNVSHETLKWAFDGSRNAKVCFWGMHLRFVQCSTETYFTFLAKRFDPYNLILTSYDGQKPISSQILVFFGSLQEAAQTSFWAASDRLLRTPIFFTRSGFLPSYDLKIDVHGSILFTPNKGSGCSACKSAVYQIARQS